MSKAEHDPQPEGAEEIQAEPLLTEIAWEAVNQVGGIYTVLRSKLPRMVERWGSRYCLIGPYFPDQAAVEFEETPPTGPFGQAVRLMREWGFEVYYGYWLVTGRPRVVLLNPFSVFDRLGEIKYMLWEHHGIAISDEDLVQQVCGFGFLVHMFLRAMDQVHCDHRKVIAHFHEWMAGTALPEMRRDNLRVGTVFTTHATMLGRYLAMNDPWFYDHLPFVNWEDDARRFNIEDKVRIERAAAHGAHVFTTVSDVTGWECEHLLGRKPDQILPNGLNIERFTALHEFQNLHQAYKQKIHQFVMAHFFHSYAFDLDKTLYFFTSGRYEYSNKGFDMTIEALARLNWRLREINSDTTVVMFFITKAPYKSINPFTLQTRAVMQELRETCQHIQEQVGERMFYEAASSAEHRIPRLDDMVDDYWRLRLRRTMQSWKSHRLPLIVTHDLCDDANDQLLNFLRSSNLVNDPYDRVKVVYHPDFVTSTNPLWGMDYDQFVRGCHMGIFPSYYEPWGYTPLECMARGVPAVTSDLSGFGCYVLENLPDYEEKGLSICKRRYAGFDEAANQLADQLFEFVQQSRRARIDQRNKTEAGSVHFDWHNLARYYDDAHERALAAVDIAAG